MKIVYCDHFADSYYVEFVLCCKFHKSKADNNGTFRFENKFSQLKIDNNGTFWLETTFSQSKTDKHGTFWLETKFIGKLTTIGHFG